MKNKSKSSLVVSCIALLALVLCLVLPSLYEPVTGKLIMGFSTTFGGAINYQGSWRAVGFPVVMFIAWMLILCAGLLAFFFGSNQKSTYAFTLCLFLAAGIMYFFTSNCTIGDMNVMGGIAGLPSSEWCAQPYTMIVLCGIGVIASIVAIAYKPNKRASKYR